MRLANREVDKKIEAEAKEVLQHSKELESLLSSQGAEGEVFWVNVKARPYYFNWTNANKLKGVFMKWQELLAARITGCLLRSLDSARFVRDGDDDDEHWAREGPAFREVLRYLLCKCEVTPYQQLPDEQLSKFPYASLDPGNPELDSEEDKKMRFVCEIAPPHSLWEEHCLDHIRSNFWSERFQRAQKESADRGCNWEEDPQFPDGLREWAMRELSSGGSAAPRAS